MRDILAVKTKDMIQRNPTKAYVKRQFLLGWRGLMKAGCCPLKPFDRISNPLLLAVAVIVEAVSMSRSVSAEVRDEMSTLYFSEVIWNE